MLSIRWTISLCAALAGSGFIIEDIITDDKGRRTAQWRLTEVPRSRVHRMQRRRCADCGHSTPTA
jgi:hypothetical protein